MSKKLSLSLAPLLALAVLAAMPAMAQAQHIFISKTKVAEGKQVPFTLSGAAKLTAEAVGDVECRPFSASGFLENPVGGGSAIGKLQSMSFGTCTDPTCTVQLGKAITVTSSKLPWKLAVTERKGVARLLIGEASTNPESMGITVTCEGVFSKTFAGQLSPVISQPPPDELVFDSKSGALEGLSFAGSFPLGGEGSAIEVKTEGKKK